MIKALLFVLAALVALCSLFAVASSVFAGPAPVRAPNSVLNIAVAPGVVRRSTQVNGIPIDVFSSEGLHGPAPAVVLAHGLDGSKERMFAFANVLAENGFIAVAFDFSGHGDNHNPLPQSDDQLWATVDRDLDQVVGYTRTLPNVSNICLLGHSLGAGAVVQYALKHPEIAGTVEISGSNIVNTTPTLPKNLLLLVGSQEIPDVKQAEQSAALHAGAGAEGMVNFLSGRARRATVIGGADHTSILISPVALSESADWLTLASIGHGSPLATQNLLFVWFGLFLCAGVSMLLLLMTALVTHLQPHTIDPTFLKPLR